MKPIRPVAVALALVVAAAAGADELRFAMNEDARDEVEFTSHAPLERITGRSAKIRGAITIPDPTRLLGDSVDAWFEVDLTTIDTGIELRNAHMRDRFLQTAAYPTATLRLREVIGAVVADDAGPDGVRAVSALGPGTPTRLSVLGSFRLHGEERQIQIDDLTVTHTPASDDTKGVRPGDLLTVRGSFVIRLDDYDIERPRGLLLRLSDKVRVEFQMTASTAIAAPSPPEE